MEWYVVTEERVKDVVEYSSGTEKTAKTVITDSWAPERDWKLEHYRVLSIPLEHGIG